MIKWTDSDRQSLIKATSSLFITKGMSTKSLINKSSESNIEFFLKRITPQVLYVLEHDLPYEIPELWDNSFYQIPWNHQRKRKSNAILHRMSWDDFLVAVEDIKCSKRKVE